MIVTISNLHNQTPKTHIFKNPKSKILIGRNPKHQSTEQKQKQVDCLIIDEPTASRTHLMIKLKNNKLKVIDLGSSNGTKINDSLIQPNQQVVISFGDEIKLGDAQNTIIIKKFQQKQQNSSSSSDSDEESSEQRSRQKKKKSIQALYKQLKISQSSLKMLKQMTSQKKSKQQKIRFLKLMGCKNLDAHWQQIEDSLKNQNKYTNNNKKASQDLQKQFQSGRATFQKKGLGIK